MSTLIDPQDVVAPEVYEAALRRVNKFRKEGGVRALKRLPPGRRGSDCECPIALALAPLGIRHMGKLQLIVVDFYDTNEGLASWVHVQIDGEDVEPLTMFVSQFDREE